MSNVVDPKYQEWNSPKQRSSTAAARKTNNLRYSHYHRQNMSSLWQNLAEIRSVTLRVPLSKRHHSSIALMSRYAVTCVHGHKHNIGDVIYLNKAKLALASALFSSRNRSSREENPSWAATPGNLHPKWPDSSPSVPIERCRCHVLFKSPCLRPAAREERQPPSNSSPVPVGVGPLLHCTSPHRRRVMFTFHYRHLVVKCHSCLNKAHFLIFSIKTKLNLLKMKCVCEAVLWTHIHTLKFDFLSISLN